MKRNKAILVFALIVILVTIAVVFPTAAFTGTAVERSATISVAADEAALVALIDGHPTGGFIEQSADGSLEIDFSRGGGQGANFAAVFNLGDESDVENNHAFRIVNQGTQSRDLELEYTLNPGSTDGDSGTRNLLFTFYYDGNDDGNLESYTLSEHPGDNQAIIPDVDVGDAVYVTIRIDTRGLSATSDLSGDLEVSAKESGSP